NDEEALKRVINYPARGIGKTTMERLTIHAAEKQVSLWEAMCTHGADLPVNSGARAKLNNFVDMMRSFAAQLDSQPAYELAEHIAKHTGLLGELYADKSPEGLSRFENIQELLNGIKEFTESGTSAEDGDRPTLGDFLVDVALLTDAD